MPDKPAPLPPAIYPAHIEVIPGAQGQPNRLRCRRCGGLFRRDLWKEKTPWREPTMRQAWIMFHTACPSTNPIERMLTP